MGNEAPSQLRRIGVIRTPFTDLRQMPIQPPGARGVRGRVEVEPEYVDGLLDLDGFSHVVLLYEFHRSRGYELRVVPFLDTRLHGVFATRAPRRPNPIGLSVVQLCKVEGGVLEVEGIDVLDGTPLLDIKPYVPAFDGPDEIRLGWLAGVSERAEDARSDDRFL
jgi:tRNA-Thr(GGU) m(6)t(6)A37 methyltransferase TsaA